MAPSEASILSSYLLNPASLPTIIPLEQFLVLFPKQYRTHPSLKTLYKDLQFLRSVDVDAVQDNIDRQALLGQRQKLLMYQSLHKGRDGTMEDVEQHQTEIDVEMFGPTGNLPHEAPLHDKQSLIHEMGKACHDLENQVHQIQSTAEGVLEVLREAIGSMSDLRYGKFSKVPGSDRDMGGEVIAALQALKNACDQTRPEAKES